MANVLMCRGGLIMRVEKTDLFVGLPAPVARDVLRRFDSEWADPAASDDILAANGVTDAETVLQALADAGFLQSSGAVCEGRTAWMLTTQGSALAQASFGKPITRATAERHVVQIVERAREYNAEPRHLFTVNRLRVFGSYLDPTVMRLGDVDIEAMYVRRHPAHDFSAAAREYTRAQGHNLPAIKAMFWPEQELIRVLRGGSSAINITTEDVDNLTDRVVTIYERGV
ncbi:hypothetical protein E3T55_18790 [Cryobacterium frigoriphilum]|uniref:Uncharacterized protein n=1 Tax=Cryobacterium frigoriphilum TaxID=1259150 RepID=A0A4R8ZTM0_9MICO|nr:hypothetical protein [Cryobacterium frigoriphilum]TFD45384.1 hypothetical protein E3T55_18790 [Cryobacterium frigoriphilum]